METRGLQLEEKSTAVECLAIRNRTKHAGVKLRWVDSDQELADGLTKMHAYDQLLRALQLNKWSIVFDAKRSLRLPKWLHDFVSNPKCARASVSGLCRGVCARVR